MDKVNIGESTLKDFGNVINEAADILNKGKVAFDNSIPDKTLQVLPYTGQVGTIIPSNFAKLDEENYFTADNSFARVITSSVQGPTDNDLHLFTYTTGIDILAQGGQGLQLGAAGQFNNVTIRTSYVDPDGTPGDIRIDSGANLVIDVTGTISMNAKAISEFKRLLGIS